MKRYFFIATMAIMAVGCQKTEIQNEVQTPIGFSTEVGKQTRAIVDGNLYPYGQNAQKFSVFAYGWQNSTPNDVPVMDDVKIAPATRTINGVEKTVWASNDGISYYWPNDPNTKLNFYAYSPSIDSNEPAHKTLNGNVTHRESETSVTENEVTTTIPAGFVLSDYVHTNQYVDFMVATPVKQATYSSTDPQTLTSIDEPLGTVPVVFNHQMTQVLFKVTTDKVYPGVTFTVEEIALKNIQYKGEYTHNTLTPAYVNTNSKFTHGDWETETTDLFEYDVFPADKTKGANSLNPLDGDKEAYYPLAYSTTSSAVETLTTTGVTMIPQDMVQCTVAQKAGEDNLATENTTAQMFMIKYSIAGQGVAEETVTKHVPFFAKDATSAVVWSPNQKITYTVKIGLNEILFEPTVANWDETTGTEYTFQQ